MNYKISFNYNKKTIIYDNFEIDIPENKITSICGHNGAGKTTLLKCICGILPPLEKNKNTWFVASSGTLIQHFSLSEHLKLIEAELSESEKLIELFELSDLKNKPISKLSTGQKMLASVIIALMSKKEFLLLDEPFAPLDPQNSEKLVEVLRSCGKTILITSHDLALTTDVSDKVIFIKNSKITYEKFRNDFSFEDLKSAYKEFA